MKEGKVLLADKEGNDRADTAAALGATESQAKVQIFGAMYSYRHGLDIEHSCAGSRISLSASGRRGDA